MTDNFYIYLADLGQDNVYKIGFTNNVQKRLTALRRGNPWFKFLTAARVSSNRDEARAIEAAVHQRFARYRSTNFDGANELFVLDEFALAEAVQFIRNLGARASLLSVIAAPSSKLVRTLASERS